MTDVTPDQIRTRLARYQDSFRRLDLERQRNGALRRADWWRHQYYNHPYMIGAPGDRVASRMQEIMFNQSELTADGKLGMLPPSQDIFMQKFTHVIEEFGFRRGGPPDDVIGAARAPLLKYFEHGEPAGVRIFRGYSAPTSPYLVKYGERKYLEPMLMAGDTRICQASYYNNASFLSSVKDDELSRTFYIPTFKERLRGEDSIVFDGNRIHFGNDDIVLPVVAQDYYLFSLCSLVLPRMPTDFKADSALIIKDPTKFSQRLIAAFLAKMPDWDVLHGPVTYYDPYTDYGTFRDVQMAKHYGYSYQREVRIAFRARRPVRTTLAPIPLCIGPMTDYAELLPA